MKFMDKLENPANELSPSEKELASAITFQMDKMAKWGEFNKVEGKDFRYVFKIELDFLDKNEITQLRDILKYGVRRERFCTEVADMLNISSKIEMYPRRNGYMDNVGVLYVYIF